MWEEEGIDWNHNGEYDQYDSDMDYDFYMETKEREDSSGYSEEDDDCSEDSFCETGSCLRKRKTEEEKAEEKKRDEEARRSLHGLDTLSNVLLIIAAILFFLFFIESCSD